MSNRNWKYNLQKWLSGRNGMDELARATYIASLVMTVIGHLLRSGMLVICSLALMGYSLWRVFSKRTYKRSDENRAFLGVYWKVANRIRNEFNKLKGRKFYRYFKCPQCHQTVRVPKGRGKIEITCPKCGCHFDGKS